ncbi:MAG: high-potential iron-sulfur protein [Acidobacteriota bacterium]|nr:MAG: high-potential iron-sulfur protein [Acidobacteriota bacterium]
MGIRRPTRRQFVQLAAAAFSGGLLGTFSGCGREQADSSGPAGSPPSECDDTVGLSEEQRQARDAVEYVSVTVVEGQRCDNCDFWEPPSRPDACGGCEVVEGPIAAPGYCALWVAMS